MLDDIPAWASGVRVKAIGAILGLPVDRLLERVEGGRRRRVATTLRFDEVSILADGADRALLGRPGRHLVEVTTSGADERLAVETHALGRGELAADLARLRELAPLEATLHDRLAERAAALGGRSAGLSERVDADGRRRWSLHLFAAAAALAEGAALGLAASQCRLAARLVTILAGAAPPVATLRLGDDAAPDLTVTFQDVAFEAVLRIMASLCPGTEPASRLGEIAGACDAERVAALSLGLRAREAPTLGVAFDLGRS